MSAWEKVRERGAGGDEREIRRAEAPSRRTSSEEAGIARSRVREPLRIHHHLSGWTGSSPRPDMGWTTSPPSPKPGAAEIASAGGPARQPPTTSPSPDWAEATSGKKAGPIAGPAHTGSLTLSSPARGLTAGGGGAGTDVPPGGPVTGEEGDEGGGGGEEGGEGRRTWVAGERPAGRRRDAPPLGEEVTAPGEKRDPRPPGAKARRARGVRRAPARKSPRIAGDLGAGGGSSPPEDPASSSADQSASSSQKRPRRPPRTTMAGSRAPARPARGGSTARGRPQHHRRRPTRRPSSRPSSRPSRPSSRLGRLVEVSVLPLFG